MIAEREEHRWGGLALLKAYVLTPLVLDLINISVKANLVKVLF